MRYCGLEPLKALSVKTSTLNLAQKLTGCLCSQARTYIVCSQQAFSGVQVGRKNYTMFQYWVLEIILITSALKTLFFFPAEKLLMLKEDDWNDFLHQVCQLTDSPEKSTGAARVKLNLLCYLCTVVGNKEVATKLISTQLVSNTARAHKLTCQQIWQKSATFC